jgi:hypothetical protein
MFKHRRWLVKYLITLYQNKKLHFTTFEGFFKDEIAFLTKTLMPKVKANYYLWTYLNWLFWHVLDYERTMKINLLSMDLNVLFLNYLNEFRTILYLSPSDYSVFHSRLILVTLLKQTFTSKMQIQEFVSSEFELIDDLLLRYPFYVTTWNYCKYFLIFIKESDLAMNVATLNKSLNNELSKSIETLFFKEDVKDSYLLENESLIKRYICLSRIIADLFKKHNREHAGNVEKLSQNFIQFLNKFIL